MSDIVDLLYSRFLDGARISTDSRTVGSGDLFFALTGERFDGNAFAHSAIDAGASCAVVSDVSLAGEKFIHVEDPLVTLQELASRHRASLHIPVVGITGSNGKTTTKELITQVLGAKYNTFATKGNLNNHIGVPLSLLSITGDTEIAVIEMGANHQREIAALCQIARPTHGMITNIGKAHLEGFGGIEGVIKGKGELFEWLKSAGGLVFVNPDLPHLADLSKDVVRKVVYRFADRVLTSSTRVEMTLEHSREKIRIRCADHEGREFPVESSLFGQYNALNIAAAIAVGLYFEVDGQRISRSIGAYTAGDNRSQVVRRGDRTIILDAYNANPTSMALAIRNFAARPAPRTLILGEMRELGKHSEQEHTGIVNLVRDYNWDRVILVGPLWGHIPLREGEVRVDGTEEVIEFVRSHPVTNGQFLLKGSRAIALERVVQALS